MALWGISTTQETWANSYAIPKWLNDQDRNLTPHNCFADERGWIYRRYQTTSHSGMGTIYTDDVLVPVSGLNTTADESIKLDGSTITGTATSITHTGIAPAVPVAVFFEDPREVSEITVAAGGTTVIGPSSTGYVHVCWNENVFCSTGATISIQTFDINNENASTQIVAYAQTAVGDVTAYTNTGIASTGGPGGYASGSAGGINEVYSLTGIDGTDFAGQITNRVSFAFTAPSTLLTANDNFASVNANHATGIGSTVFYVANADLEGVSTASSVTIYNNLGIGVTNAPIIAVGDTSFTIGGPTGAGITIRDQQTVGIGSTIVFSNFTSQTVLKINMDRGVVGTVTSFYESTAALKTFVNSSGISTRPNAAIPIGIDRNIGGAGTCMSGSFEPNAATGTVDGTGVVGLGTTALKVGIWATTF